MLMMVFYMVFLTPLCLMTSWTYYMYFFFFFFFFFFIYFKSSYFLESVSYIFGLDMISYLFICLGIWICILMVYSMFVYMFCSNSFYFLFCINFLSLMLFLVFTVFDFFYFYFFFEGSLIPVFLIIFGWGYQPERLSAGYFLIFYTLFVSFPFLLVILSVHFYYGSFFFFFDFFLLSDFMMFFIFISFMVSFPLFGLHLWLPSAHVEAPVSGSMILAGVMLKLGGYGLFRMMSFIYFFFLNYNFFFMSLSMFGCILVSLFCLVQSDLKMLIAYSSVCHMSMVICGILTMTCWGCLGSLIFMLGHGFVSSGLFFLVSLVYDRVGSRSIFVIKGMVNFLPSLSLFWFMFCISNMSCPPSINLFSEVCIILGLMSWSHNFFIFIFFVLFFSACYSLTIFFLTQHGQLSSMFKFVSFCSVRDYFILILHLFPVFFLMFDMFYFFYFF